MKPTVSDILAIGDKQVTITFTCNVFEASHIGGILLGEMNDPIGTTTPGMVELLEQLKTEVKKALGENGGQ